MEEERFSLNDLTTGGNAAGGNGYTNAFAAVTGLLSGIFTAIGIAKPKDSTHLYAEAVVVPESKLDKAPYIYGGAAIAVLVFSIYLLKKA